MQIHKIFFGKNKSQHVQIKLPNNCNILCNKSLKVIYIDIITGWTPLLQASWHGKTEVAKILLENGADIEAKNEYGNLCFIDILFVFTKMQYFRRDKSVQCCFLGKH